MGAAKNEQGAPNGNVTPLEKSILHMVIMDELTDFYLYSMNMTLIFLLSGIEISSSCGGDCFLYAICAHINLLVKSSSLFFVTTNGRSLAPVTSHADGEPLAISVKDIAISKLQLVCF